MDSSNRLDNILSQSIKPRMNGTRFQGRKTLTSAASK